MNNLNCKNKKENKHKKNTVANKVTIDQTGHLVLNTEHYDITPKIYSFTR